MCFMILTLKLLDYSTAMKCVGENTFYCCWNVMMFTVQWYWSESSMKYVSNCRNTTYLL